MSDIEDVWRQQNAVLRDDVINNIMPETMALWSKKNADYEGQLMFLGKRGQFSDLNRKFWKLKKALWDGQDLGFESAEEVCMDMIGHLLMTIHMLRTEQPRESPIFKEIMDDLNRLGRTVTVIEDEVDINGLTLRKGDRVLIKTNDDDCPALIEGPHVWHSMDGVHAPRCRHCGVFGVEKI